MSSAWMRLGRREPEELLRGGEGIGVRTRRSGKVGERAGGGGRGLQSETGVGPAQHQLVVHHLKIERNAWLASLNGNDAIGIQRKGAKTPSRYMKPAKSEPRVSP